MTTKKDEDVLSFDALDVRPVPVDQLVHNDEHNIVSRRDRLLTWKDRGTKIVETAQADLDKSKELYEFVERELEGADLAILLKRGDKVRVECPDCQGTGLRPEDVTSGQYRKAPPTAFSSGKTGPTPANRQPPRPTDKQKCQKCEGKRWLIMNRFKG